MASAAVEERALLHFRPDEQDAFQPDVQIFLSSSTSKGGSSTSPVEVLRGAAVTSIKVQLKADLTRKGWHSGPRSLVFGEKDLDATTQDTDSSVRENIPNGEVPIDDSDDQPVENPVDNKLMHLLFKLEDIEFVTVKALEVTWKDIVEREFCVPLRKNRSVSELTNLIQSADALEPNPIFTEEPATDRELALMLGDRVLPNDALLGDVGVQANTVMHLILHRSAKFRVQCLGYHTLEVEVTSGHKRDDVKKKLRKSASSPAEFTREVPEAKQSKKSRPLVERSMSRCNVLSLDGEDVLPEAQVGSPGSDESSSYGSVPILSKMGRSIEQARQGLEAGLHPTLADSGTGGTYFLSNEDGETVAVFKPQDEEPLAMNNPRAELEPSATGEGLRKGTRVGEGAFREVAAYILDHDNFSGVPPTTFATLSGRADINDSSTNTDYDCDGSEPSTPKQGSLQEFVRSISDCEEMGPSKYSVDEVHKITILDMRLGNTDRNGANILVSEMPGDVDQYKLIPIDHGYTLPHSLQDLSFEWEYWPQARLPYSQQSLEYISNLDADADLLMLAAHNIRLPADCQRVFRVCTLVLKTGAALGLVPASISECMTRKIWNQMSDLEKMSARALNVAVGKQTRASGRPSQLVTEAQEKRYFQELSVLLEEYFSSLKEENVLDNLQI